MSMKRKLSLEFDDSVNYSVSYRLLSASANIKHAYTHPDFAPSLQNAKRPNLFQFPSTDTDVAMSDASSDTELLTPLELPDHTTFHTRLISNASTASSVCVSGSSSTENSPSSSRTCPLSHASRTVSSIRRESAAYYPDFVLYPSVDHDIAMNAPNRFNSPANYSPRQVGLIQPKGGAFTHHG